MGLKLQGSLEMRLNLRNLSRDEQESAIRGVDEFEQVEMAEMKRRVPVKTGELRDSGYTDKPELINGHIIGGLGFNAEHAMIVHEDLEAIHPNGEAKYMESVLNESEPHFAERVADYVVKDLKL